MNVLLSGSSGFIGSALKRELTREGHVVFCLSRFPTDHPREVFWNTETGAMDEEKLAALGSADAVVHLAGENIANGRWSSRRKAEIWNSRVPATERLAKCLLALKSRPSIFIGASAVGFYGNRGEEVLTESSARGAGFLAELCEAWEKAADPLAGAGARVFHPRFGMILSASGGALAKMLPIFKLGLGGRLGSGEQWMSWISLRDAVGVILSGLKTQNFSGAVNAVSPGPVRNRDFTRAVAGTLKRPAVFSVPRTILKLAYGEMADEVLLNSLRVMPERLRKLGFQFHDTDLKQTLETGLSRETANEGG
jgi:uncharacterized protein (TIGR01777 family)